jgi:hypothetical protein
VTCGTGGAEIHQRQDFWEQDNRRQYKQERVMEIIKKRAWKPRSKQPGMEPVWMNLPEGLLPCSNFKPVVIYTKYWILSHNWVASPKITLIKK